MKIGDLIFNKSKYDSRNWGKESQKGVIVEFIPATHSKQVQKVRVLAYGKIEDWILQYCELVNESR